ncbi:MAG: putative rane protein [Cyanobacteriota bacterium]
MKDQNKEELPESPEFNNTYLDSGDSNLQEDISISKVKKENSKDEPEIVKYRYEERTSPIPDPAILEEYNRLVPGFAKELLTSFAEEGRHRRELENQQMKLEHRELDLEEQALKTGTIIAKANTTRANWGLVCGTFIFLTLILKSYQLLAVSCQLFGFKTPAKIKILAVTGLTPHRLRSRLVTHSRHVSGIV